MPDLPPPVPAIEFNLASTGMSKGLAQTTGPQVLARGELASGSVYVGAYAKNVSSTSSDGEAGALLGFRTRAAGLDLAASAAWKQAIDPAPGSDANALELNASVGGRLGRMAPRVSVTWSPDDIGATGRTLFAELGATYRLTRTLAAGAAVGRRERSGGPDYTAWNGGVAWTPRKGMTLDLRYYDTDGGDTQPYRARLVGSARLKF